MIVVVVSLALAVIILIIIVVYFKRANNAKVKVGIEPTDPGSDDYMFYNDEAGSQSHLVEPKY